MKKNKTNDEDVFFTRIDEPLYPREVKPKKTEKQNFTTFIGFLIIFTELYLTFSFVLLDFNFLNWNLETRLLFILILRLGMIIEVIYKKYKNT
jgi:hypothetical protein